MSHYERCKKCGGFGWFGSHRCFEYIVKIPKWTGDEEQTC